MHGNEVLNVFPDIQNHWAKNYIVLGKYLGIAWGYPDGTFKPEQPATRAEALVFAMRALGIGILVTAGAGALTYWLAKKAK